MPLIDQLRGEFGRLNDPNYVKQLIAEKQTLYQPQLQQSFTRIDADLNRRGLYSASPVTRGRFRATSEFNRGISEQVQGDVTRRYETILPLLAQLELAEKEGRRQDKAGIMKLIGTVLGTGAGFLIGGPPGAAIGAGLGSEAGGSIGSVSAPKFDYTPYNPGGG